jgi:hypothetical protein
MEGEKATGGVAAAALLERGLRMYGNGDLLGALAEWEAALTLDPGLARAREYIDYVRANFDALTEQFRAVRQAESNAAEAGVPVMDVPDDPEAYDSLDVELGGSSDELADGLAALDAGLDHAIEEPLTPRQRPDDLAPPRAAAAAASPSPVEEEEDGGAVELEAMAPDEDLPGIAPDLEGLDLRGQAADGALDDEATIDVRMHRLLQRSTPPAGADLLPPAVVRPGIMTIQPRRGRPAPTADLDEDLPPEEVTSGGETREHTPLGAPLAFGMDDLELGHLDEITPSPDHDRSIDVPAIGDEAEATQAYERRRGGIVVTPQRPAARKTPTFDFDEPEPTTDFEDVRLTRERSFQAPAAADADQDLDEPQPLPSDGTTDSSVIVDERLLQGAGLLDQTPPAGENDVERTGDYVNKKEKEVDRQARDAKKHQRVSELLRQAREHADKGEFLRAVGAVEDATECDEDGTVAPVLLHRHRDLVYRIYEGHIGDLSAVPLISVPMHEISSHSLDHRTGFLLSRIDGMLTFEDILDVAGMPRMEAYTILSRLLRKGVIEVR